MLHIYIYIYIYIYDISSLRVKLVSNDIDGNVQADFVYVFYFFFDYFTKSAKSRMLPKIDKFICGH